MVAPVTNIVTPQALTGRPGSSGMTSSDRRSGDDSPEPRGAVSRVAKASFMGTFVEWFDYAAYGYLAATIALVFFPEDEGRSALIKTFGLFALSFLIRPIGGVVWGHLGDRYGRKRTLSLSILMMSGATFLIALLPGHAAIGAAAPALLFSLRLVQGFSAAGEYAGASTYLAETAPAHRRGLFGAIVPASTACGLLAGSLLAALLTGVLDDAAMQSWGWRVPFLLAAPLGLIGLYIRRRADALPATAPLEVVR